jgi:hypothetical protein
MLENTDGNNHSPKIAPTTPALVSEQPGKPGYLHERFHLERVKVLNWYPTMKY